MSKGHYIKISKNDGLYVFQLWYCGKQEMGCSNHFETYEKCIKGIKVFKDYLIASKPTEENGLIKVLKLENKKYVYVFYNEKGEKLYSSREIEKKYNCSKSANSTCKNFVDAKIK